MKSIVCRSLLALAAVALLALPLSSAEPVSRGFLNRTFIDAEGRAHPFVIFVPVKFEPGSKPPVMLFLHGAGERGDDNLAQLQYLPSWLAQPRAREAFPCYVLAPQCRRERMWTDVDWSARESTPQRAAP